MEKEVVLDKKKRPKAKFVPNGTGVDAVPVDIPAKAEKKEPEVKVADLEKEFKGMLTMDTDKNGFTNFRSGKYIEFYAIDRVQGFIGLSTRDATTKSGWRTDRIVTKDEFDNAIKTLKLQLENKQKFATAYIPWYHCPCCDYTTQNKDEMTNHLSGHGDDN